MQTRFSLGAFGIGASLVIAGPACATEGGVFGGPVGGTDIRTAYLPPKPGLYIGAVAVIGTARELMDPDGEKSPILNPASYRAINQAIGLVFIYPFKPLGFIVASTFQGGISEQRQTLTIPGAGFRKGTSVGAADSYTDLIYVSRHLGGRGANLNAHLPYGLTIGGGLALELPVGTVRVPNIPSPGKNIFITIPNASFTYLTGPRFSIGDGTEISARFFYEILKRDGITKVKSGNLVDLDWAVSERFKSVQFGVAGAFASQIAPDRLEDGSRVAPAGNYYERLSLGAVAAYDLPGAGGTVKLKALFPVRATNSYNATVASISYSRRVF
jgi:hypothetical protein